MKVYEFPAKITSDGSVELPGELAKLLADTETIRVIVVVDEPKDGEEDAAWSRLAAEQFLKGYAEIDSIYDEI